MGHWDIPFNSNGEHKTRPPDRDLAAEIDGLESELASLQEIISAMVEERDNYRRIVQDQLDLLKTQDR